MSQLSGKLGIDLKSDVTFAAVFMYTATQQPRRKIIWEAAERNTEMLPRIAIELDEKDFLYVIAEDKQRRTVQTPKLSPLRLAFRPFTIRFTSQPSKTDDHVKLSVWIDGLPAGSADGACDLSSIADNIEQSIGSRLSGEDPATFTAQTLAVFHSILNPEEAAKLDHYMASLAGITA